MSIPDSPQQVRPPNWMPSLSPVVTLPSAGHVTDSHDPTSERRASSGLSRSLAAAEGFLLSQLVPPKDGVGLFFGGPMKGRLLEAALTLHLIQKNRLNVDWSEPLRSYLMDNLDSADAFSGSVARAVLSMSSRGSSPDANNFGLNGLLGSLEYAKKRKHALLGMILTEVGVVPFQSVTSNPDSVAEEAVHLFSQLYLTAMKVMRLKWQPSSSEMRAEVEFLAKAQGSNGGWEQQALITILALLALGPAHRSFDGGLRFLKSLVREDGGVAFTDNLNLWTTALAALALQRTNAVPAAVFHQVAEYIVSRQLENGGWAFSEGVTQTDTDTASQCVQVLIQLDPERYAEPIARAHEYFLRLQRPDGGYPTYELAGDSEVIMTANIALVQALCIERRPELREPIQRALRFIRSRQKPDGTFERSWCLSETYSIFRVNLALNGCRGVDDDAAASAETERRSLAYLLEQQFESGGWGQTSRSAADTLSTAYGLLALVLMRRQLPREDIDLAVEVPPVPAERGNGGVRLHPGRGRSEADRVQHSAPEHHLCRLGA